MHLKQRNNRITLRWNQWKSNINLFMEYTIVAVDKMAGSDHKFTHSAAWQTLVAVLF